MTSPLDDPQAENLFSQCMAAHEEQLAYQTLVAAARKAGDDKKLRMFEPMLREAEQELNEAKEALMAYLRSGGGGGGAKIRL